MTAGYSDSNLRVKYALAMTFLFFVPGSLLSIFSRFQPAFLPRAVVELLFPMALFPFEKQSIVALNNEFASVNQARMDPEIFDRLDIFGQQIFVVALLSFFLMLVIYGLKVRAGALYAQPTIELMPVLVILIIASVVARVFFAYLLVANMDSINSNLPSQIAVFHLLNAIAPEGLILFDCLMAISLAQIALFIYGLLPERIR